ncbi:MAG TPA: ABC transporter permease [Ktedonobacteraceae bacterium]|jgi:ABC-type dipeptide/oligopeptide/nickel transport system permease component|nr:ABC transporter permease [Ktedonobacteraceae bacterium]
MVQFLVKRFIGLLFVVVGVTFITFIMGYFAPGDPVLLMLGQHYNQAAYVALKHVYGLDLPWYQQYWNYLKNLFTFNFGLSYEYKDRAVSAILASGVPISLELGSWALLLTLIVGLPLGILSALKANTWVDTTNMTVMLILFAVPTFVLAVFVQVFIVWIDQSTGASWPVSNWGTPWHYSWSDIQYKLAPIIVLAAGAVAFYARLMRTQMLEVLRQDYVRTARAKGLRERIVIYRHALRNALIPIITTLGVALGSLVGGAFFIEDLFNIPGIAGIALSSIGTRDYPVIQATTVILAVAVVLGNLLSDILYTVVDPRIKVE